MNRQTLTPRLPVALFLLAALAALAVFAGCITSSPSDEERSMFSLRFYPSQVSATVDTTETVEIMVDHATSLITARLTVSYDPAFIEIISVDATSADMMFYRYGSDIYEIERTIDNENGRLIIGVGAMTNDFKGASGSGTLAAITFRAKQPGSTRFRFVTAEDNDIVLTSYSNQTKQGWLDLEPATFNGTVTVE